jgi:hypothetical protein
MELINVLSSYGIAVNYLCEDGYDGESYEINTVQWPGGLYTLCFKIADDLSFVRVIKR